MSPRPARATQGIDLEPHQLVRNVRHLLSSRNDYTWRTVHAAGNLGHFPRCIVSFSCRTTICSSDCPHVSNEACWSTQYPDDGHTDSWSHLHGALYCFEVRPCCSQLRYWMHLTGYYRPGTNWTSWTTYAVAGTMQGMLLAMCIIWKLRQSKLRIDDFGNPLDAGYDVVEGITLSGAGTETSLPSTPSGSDINEGLLSPATEPSERTPLLPNPDVSHRRWWNRR